jgi:hypothetical protein
MPRSYSKMPAFEDQFSRETENRSQNDRRWGIGRDSCILYSVFQVINGPRNIMALASIEAVLVFAHRLRDLWASLA